MVRFDPATRKYDLTKASTRELLELLNYTRKFNGGVDPTFNCGSVYITAKELKAELANRPHVPNKQEAKLRRKTLAKQNKGRGKAKNR